MNGIKLPPISSAELSTILGALRFYQYVGMADVDQRPAWLDAIVCDQDEDEALSDGDIDTLCERLNLTVLTT